MKFTSINFKEHINLPENNGEFELPSVGSLLLATTGSLRSQTTSALHTVLFFFKDTPSCFLLAVQAVQDQNFCVTRVSANGAARSTCAARHEHCGSNMTEQLFKTIYGRLCL